ncbi:MAG: alpha-1,2-fucosyltransferase [Lachnospiraceae bacterium]|nr:alpha-1,2-fucosyltransferase [Lachnospiraceae bacterium]
MIILRITSGLGNQMFQYAFYTLLQEKYKDTEILCDTTWFHNNHEGREYELEKIFSGVNGSLFEIKKASVSQVTNLSGRIPNLFDGSFGKIFDKIRRYPNRLLKDIKLKKRLPYILEQYPEVTSPVSEDEFFDAVMNLDTSKDYYITGYFIEEKFYSKIIDRVREKLLFPVISEEWNLEYADKISNCDSVSIHVRRGDYLSDLYKDKFLTLGKEYYEKAVEYVTNYINGVAQAENRAADIRFFIFSDDAEFVMKEFDWIKNKTIITGNTQEKSFRDMQLMSMCRHNITANSTFSQWGALLNQSPNHITIYPKTYMVDSDNEIKSDESWVRI